MPRGVSFSQCYFTFLILGFVPGSSLRLASLCVFIASLGKPNILGEKDLGFYLNMVESGSCHCLFEIKKGAGRRSTSENDGRPERERDFFCQVMDVGVLKVR